MPTSKNIKGKTTKNGTIVYENENSTNFKIEGNTLIQVVNFDENDAFPIVADPDWWKVTKCAGAIAWVIGSTVFCAAKLLKIKKYIKALGGVREAAILLTSYTTWEEKMNKGGKALVQLAAELTGVSSLSVCFK